MRKCFASLAVFCFVLFVAYMNGNHIFEPMDGNGGIYTVAALLALIVFIALLIIEVFGA